MLVSFITKMLNSILIPFTLVLLLGLGSFPLSAQKVRYDAGKTTEAPVLDGTGNDDCWIRCEWGLIDQQWFTERNMPDSADFYGRYKVVWTNEMLYLLLEITDDAFIDDIADPLTNYWEDDCIEVFLDEDKSGGDHKCCSQAYNAFAYHTSPITFDAVDLSDDGDFVPKLFNDNVDIAVKSADNLHTIEIAIKVFDNTFNEDSINTPLTLNANKLMGFSIAYCDDDGYGREDFLASQAGGLDSWMDASLFGELLLVDNQVSAIPDRENRLVIYPNPSLDQLFIRADISHYPLFELINQDGSVVITGVFNRQEHEHVINIEGIEKGIYFFRLMGDAGQLTNKVMVN